MCLPRSLGLSPFPPATKKVKSMSQNSNTEQTDKTPLEVNLENIPDQLKRSENWIGWKEEQREGRLTKVPYNPETGKRASSTDPETWTDFSAVKESPEYGLGFVFTDTPFTGIDLDHCRDPETGKLESWAKKIVDILGSYTEISPSGEGLHILIKGELPGDRNRTGDIEMYDTDRYFTVTGDLLNGNPGEIKERSKELETIYEKIFDNDRSEPAEKPRKATGDGTGLTDSDVIEKARNGQNSGKFETLWSGDASNYPSHSEADLALCSILAFYTGPVPGQIDRLFRQSGLVRDKWTEREDYRERTISRAIEGTEEFYQKPSGRPPEKKPPPPEEDPTPSENNDRWAAVNKEFKDGSKKKARFKAAQTLLDEREFVAFSEGDQLLTYRKNEGTFNDYGPEFIERKVQRELTSEITSHDVNEIINHIKRSTYQRQRDFGPDKPSLVCVKNGVLDLETGELYDHSPKYEFQRSLPVEYDPKATSEQLDSFLESTLRDKDIPLIEEAAGFALYREYFLRKAIMFIGEGGNGKTIMLQLIENLLGHENVAGWTLQELETNQYAKANLYKKYANIAGDLPGKRLADTGIFKQLTGRDHITGDVKYAKRPIEFVNYAKLLFSTNNVPVTPDDTEAFFDRWVLIEFPYKFVEDPTRENEKKKDPEILEKITTERAKSAFLNRAIQGLNRLKDNGEFSFDKSTSQVRKQYERLSQPIKAFADDYLIQDEENFIPKDKVYNAYREYCEKNELPVKDKAVFSRRLGKHLKVGSGRRRIEGKRKRCYEHIDLDQAPF